MLPLPLPLSDPSPTHFYINNDREAKKVFQVLFFWTNYLADARPTLGHSLGGSLTHLMIITTISLIRPKGHQEPR